MDIKEDLEEMKHLNSEEPEDEGPKRNWFMIIGSILIVFLLVSWVFARYPIASILIGQLRSGRVSGKTLETYGLRLEFTNSTIADMVNAWYEHPDTEAVLCVRGSRSGDVLTFTSAYEPFVFEATYTSVRHQPCDEETLMLFHTHPYKSCLASDQDIYTLRNRQLNYPDTIMMIMCEGNRYSVYS